MRCAFPECDQVLRSVLCLLAGLAFSACDKSNQSGRIPATIPAEEAPATQASLDWPAMSPPALPARLSTSHGLIALQDVLWIRVFDLVAPNTPSIKPVHVAADGTVQPFDLGPVHVAGLTDGGAEAAISKAYTEANIINHAMVSVRRLVVASAGTESTADAITDFDLLRVSVSDLEGPGSDVLSIARVDGSGMFGLLYIGPQKLAGLTEEAAEKSIAQAYRDRNIVNGAMVSVFRLEQAPSGAGQIDLPDVPLQPIPEALQPFEQESDRAPIAPTK
jgi:protein involved in polysaccharide export with SLBB domain